MIRRQLYITPEIDRALEIEARRQGKSEARLAREILGKELKVKNKSISAADALVRMAQNSFKGPGDLSTNLFDYLYGKKSPNYGPNKPKLTKQEMKNIEFFTDAKLKKTSN
ncbi:MAG: hypothetical protein A3F61_03085 [Candidatus Blackburnbacteria bacterium RIFCSPHIGHO2_12_FULL_41_13b]|uniref:Ribbon-helix-helix protein CopG domain-containing protein n=1 Tax=Candidatus Blackburnbacteria bacterium RIFCSPHIGHO2_12_FULL_41_13b TaxID=1797517 RepID=A0A1G1V7N5_9BACT|nr:MAG: hypothetical protein A3F61_03085 [Candidatus Blackburnbacteria bacterium RIFCSPHIGHO2_12_FULL_41_13b]